MTHEEIAWQLYDELQHNRITNYDEYSKRLYELLDLAHPNEEKVGDYVSEVENIMHNKWSFGFCDMCDEVIFYDTDAWFDLCGEIFENERDNLEKRLPVYEKEVGHDIQDVCSTCFHKLVDNKENE
jgi:hypothetical protein